MVKAWQYENPQDGDNTINVGRTDDGVVVAVSEERAVDSYNAYFTLEIDLPLREAQALRDWLIANVPKQPALCRHTYNRYGDAPNKCLSCGEVRVKPKDAPDAQAKPAD